MALSSALPISWVFIRLLILLNWLSGAAILALLTATIVAEQWTMNALGIPSESGIRPMLNGLRLIAVCGLGSVPLNNAVLARLLAIVDTVRRGDPFVRVNAYRLNAIAWALLALQLLSLVVAGLGKAIETAEVPLHLDAGFSIGGWLAVLFAFVLTRVFIAGTLMRDDLEATV